MKSESLGAGSRHQYFLKALEEFEGGICREREFAALLYSSRLELEYSDVDS